MKKTILLMLGMAAMLASCSQDELDTAQGAGTAVITATVDDGIATRSTYEQDDVDITRCLLEVRDAEGNLVGKQHEMTEGTDDTFTFTVRGLDPDETYTYIFWADNGTAYDAEDLTTVTMKDLSFSKLALAFSGTTTSKPGEISATLTHAVAKVSVKTTGEMFSGDKVSVALNPIYTKLNVFTGEIGGSGTYTSEDKTHLGNTSPGTEVGTFYFLAPAEGTVCDMTITYTSGETKIPVPKTVTNVPLRANYRTLVSGDIANISATDVTTTLSKDNWNDNEGAQLITYVINLETAGTLTDEMIDKAIAQNGGRIVIKGKVNQQDIDKLVGGTSIYLNIVSIDMSNATLDDQNKAWPYTYTGIIFGSDGGTLEAVVLPEGIESLANGAFQDQTNLKTIKLPSTLVSIGKTAFRRSRLIEITIPESVTTIGREAFQGAYLSGELTIPKNVTSIGDYAFNGILTTSLVWNANLTLSKEAFSFCPELTTVTINGNVSSFDAEIATNFLKLKTITFTSVTDVPEFAGNDLSSFGQVKIYVPENLVDAFKAADGWSQFADNIFPLQ